MKKLLTWLLCLMMLVSAVPALAYTTGTYTGTGTGMLDKIEVAVTFDADTITGIEVVSCNDTPGVCDAAVEKIPAEIVKYQSLGVEVVFACGGGIYLSCLSAAESNDGKMIGVDVDQSNVSDRIITSAMKALSNSVVKALTDASANDWTWPESYAGVCQYLGAADDCVGLPMETSQFTKFTQEQYDTLFQAMADGSLVVDNNSSADVKPVTTNVTVDYQ